MHIADINLAEFYSSAFHDLRSAGAFVTRVKSLSGPHPAKLALHQTARMLWLGDRIDEFARGRPALQILFYIIAAEAVAKMAFSFRGEGRSKAFVLRFFESLCGDEHRRLLGSSFQGPAGLALSWKEAVEMLYDIRCDVVHEARYFEFHLPQSGEVPLMTFWNGQTVVARMSCEQLRRIVLEGAVAGINKLLAPGTEASSV